MPSIAAPTFYDRAKFVAAGRADQFLKWLDEDEYIETTGSVDQPLGWVGLIHVRSETIATWVSSQGDPWMSEARNFEPGWYIVRQDDNGLVWGMGYGPDSVFNEEGARADFLEAEMVSYLWDLADDQISPEEG